MILVTGGAGYVGCVLVRELLGKGESVRVFDKLLFGDEGLQEVRDKVELIEGDLRYFDEAVLDGIDSVIHLAGLSNDPTAEFKPQANYEINTVATEVLASACKRRGIRRFVFASTCSVYDKGLYAEDFLLDEASEVSPRAAYAVSNYEAERALLAMADDRFCPVILRKGTLYGFSPRMRYDLVVNTFVKDALMTGTLQVISGGEMWRPLVDVADAAKAYVCCVEAPEHKVRGQIFNLVFKNYRILELAHWVREAFRSIKKLEIEVDYSHSRARSYRVSGQKIETILGFKPTVAVKESVKHMVKMIQKNGHTDYLNPKYYNIQWLMLLSEMEGRLKRMGSVF